MKKVPISQAAKWTRKRAYFWSARAQAYKEIQHARRRGPNWEITLVDGHCFEVVRETIVYTK
jgi:hypothetical protein